MRLRQIALIARELDPVVEDLCAVLDLEVAYRDPGVRVFGLHNAVMPVGDTFLEVVSPIEPNTAGGRFLERRGGDSGYMVIVQVDDLDAARERARRDAIRVAWEIALDDIRAMHLHPRDTGGTLLSLDQPTPPEAWRWAGPRWRAHQRTTVARSLRSAEIQGDDPSRLAARWAVLLDRPVRRLGTDRLVLDLPDGDSLGFGPALDGRGPCLAGFGVDCADPARALSVARERDLPIRDRAVRVAGTWIHLEENAAART